VSTPVTAVAVVNLKPVRAPCNDIGTALMA